VQYRKGDPLDLAYLSMLGASQYADRLSSLHERAMREWQASYASWLGSAPRSSPPS
jgi:hypothetical protein